MGEVRGDAISDQLITFAGLAFQPSAIENRDLATTPGNHAGKFKLADNMRDRWTVGAQHIGEQVLRDEQGVAVNAVTHRKEPARQALLKAVSAITRDGDHDLLEKGRDIGKHELPK